MPDAGVQLITVGLLDRTLKRTSNAVVLYSKILCCVGSGGAESDTTLFLSLGWKPGARSKSAEEISIEIGAVDGEREALIFTFVTLYRLFGTF
jgi:hypothetical protein